MYLLLTLSSVPSVIEHSDLMVFLLSVAFSALLALSIYVFKSTFSQFSEKINDIAVQFTEKLGATVDQFEKSVALFNDKVDNLESDQKTLFNKQTELELKLTKIEVEHSIFNKKRDA